MKQLIEFIKTTMLGGILIIIPAAAIVFLLIKVAHGFKGALDPVAAELPQGVQFPYMTEIVSVLIVCFLAGLIIRTRPGRWIAGLIERHVFDRVPGYAMVKGLTGRSVSGTMGQAVVPALVDMEEGLVPALIIERHDDGYVTVFVPSPPVPTVGQAYVFEASKAHPVDVTLPKFIGCITKWGCRRARTAVGDATVRLRFEEQNFSSPSPSAAGA